MTAANSRAALRKRPPKADHWAIWPAIAALAIALGLAVLCGLPGIVSFVLVPMTVLGAPFVGAGLLAAAFVVGVRRRPRRAVSVLAAVILPACLWTTILRTADYVHLALTVWTGAGQLGGQARPDGSPFATYDWSVGFAGGPNRFLIYDVTDEIAIPPKLHKQALAVEQGFGEDCAGRVRHLLAHYYVCAF